MYFKDTQNKPFFEPSSDVIRKHSLVEISREEFDAIVVAIKTPTTKQLADTARAERDRLIESVRWRIERHSDGLALGREPTEPLEPLEPLLRYTQALRDVPQQEGFPETISWPELPAR